MAGQGPHNPTSGYSSGPVPGQAQMRRSDLVDQPSHNQDHESSFLQETGTQMKNMAQGAAEIGKGAALGAVNMARGAAIGAANIAHGAADAVKHTLGMDANANANVTHHDNNTSNLPSHTNTNHPANCPNNTNCSSNLGDTTNYPANLMDDPAPTHFNNPSNRKNI
ncbi:hypothetical protein ACH5RR_008165 [Cinchona calisaya]|uniref:Uncharacterized protein n=1 Tax=Cinchona calisaya TaxID=153742 RepID=A0ABD3AGP1_9GENT